MNSDSVSAVVIGDVDHGKSTLIGRLLSDSRALRNLAPDLHYQETIAEYAFAVDALQEEREGLFTLDTTRIILELFGRRVILIDVPGHGRLLQSFITGVSQAQIAVIVVDVSEGLSSRTIEQCSVLRLLGISTCVVTINKMDTVSFNDCVFERVKADALSSLGRLGLRATHTVPISALRGANLINRALESPWYHGPTLAEALSELPVRFAAFSRTRFSVQDCYVKQAGLIVVGRVEAGEVTCGQPLRIHPGGQDCRIRSIEAFGIPARLSAPAGECIGLTLEPAVHPRAGQVLTPPEDAPLVSADVPATILNLDLPPIDVGQEFTFKCGSLEIPCRIATIAQWNLPALPAAASRIEFNSIRDCVISFAEPVALERFHDVPSLGRFVLARRGKVGACGIVNDPDAKGA